MKETAVEGCTGVDARGTRARAWGIRGHVGFRGVYRFLHAYGRPACQARERERERERESPAETMRSCDQ